MPLSSPAINVLFFAAQAMTLCVRVRACVCVNEHSYAYVYRRQKLHSELPRAPAEIHGLTPHLTLALSGSQQVLETLAEDPTTQPETQMPSHFPLRRHPVLLTDRVFSSPNKATFVRSSRW